ncbi:MAG: hypothetical protein JWQ76_2863 [Ramlibacter sp.]|nr:hypothetical protein [Ramlibacter sp.]
MCGTVTLTPADGREMAKRSECVLAGVIPSSNRIAEARDFARGALAKGEPAGGLMIYLTFQNDPANQYVRDGKADQEAYARLAARPLDQRRDQIEAIEGLGFAAGKGNRPAGMLLASYFHDTVAPQNVVRVDALVSLLMRDGDRPPQLERMAREADAIRRAGRATKASVRSFLEAHQQAVLAAIAGYKAQTGGGTCQKPALKSLSSGDIAAAEYLPLKGKLVADSYLMRGEWSEFWLFDGCGQEIPVKVSFRADGWGGSRFTAVHNKGG